MKQLQTSIRQVRTVTVPVANQQRSLDFYTSVLGFEPTIDAQFGPGQRWIEVAPPDGGTTIALPPRGDVAPGVDTGIRLSTESAEGDHAALRAAGVDVDDEVLMLPGVPPMFSFRDPDGNTLYIVERMESGN
jgi:catechol 2,3-dioxygenase-like lactoylglutathione lyase family enzyme